MVRWTFHNLALIPVNVRLCMICAIRGNKIMLQELVQATRSCLGFSSLGMQLKTNKMHLNSSGDPLGN